MGQAVGQEVAAAAAVVVGKDGSMQVEATWSSVRDTVDTAHGPKTHSIEETPF